MKSMLHGNMQCKVAVLTKALLLLNLKLILTLKLHSLPFALKTLKQVKLKRTTVTQLVIAKMQATM
ncbi:Uncharacterised protein [Acinetobacter baumannii]|nr:Uncharacterised protein [Acinetobacter baumannii]